MAHLIKCNASSAGGLLRHDLRTEQENHTRKNIDIDKSRTALNYSLAEPPMPMLFESENSFKSYVKKFAESENIHLLNRKDVNVMCSWVVTKPADVQPAEQERFFKECNKFLSERYGFKAKDGTFKNIISSVVHLDETTPHLHFKFIPTIYDKEKKRNTVSAKLVVNRKDLQTFHKDLSRRMEKVFGRDIGIENGATAEGNRLVSEIKALGGKLEKDIINKQAELAQMQAITTPPDFERSKKKKKIFKTVAELPAEDFDIIKANFVKLQEENKDLNAKNTLLASQTRFNENKVLTLAQENKALTERVSSLSEQVSQFKKFFALSDDFQREYDSFREKNPYGLCFVNCPKTIIDKIEPRLAGIEHKTKFNAHQDEYVILLGKQYEQALKETIENLRPTLNLSQRRGLSL